MDQFGLIGYENIDTVNNWRNVEIKKVGKDGDLTIIGYRSPFVNDEQGKDVAFKCGSSQQYVWIVGEFKGKWSLDTESTCDLAGEGKNKVVNNEIQVYDDRPILKFPVSKNCLNGEGDDEFAYIYCISGPGPSKATMLKVTSLLLGGMSWLLM